MLNRADIVAKARGWLGVPWRHQGRTKNGIDCVGLIILVAQDVGYTDKDERGYSRRPDGRNFIARFSEEMDEITLADIRPGDVLVFADNCYPCHCAFLTEKNGAMHIIHAHATRRQVLEERYAFEWPQKVRKAFRFKGMEE